MKFTKITNSSETGTLNPHWDGWLQERFPGHFAQISTVNTLRLKNSIRDVARFLLGSVPYDIEEICKKLPVPPQGVSDEKFLLGYDNDEGHVPGIVDTNSTIQEYINKYPNHWEIVKKCLSLWRSKGRHAAGYVISNEPIAEFIPVTEVGGVKVLDFTGPEVESVGGIKYDFLVVNAVNDVQSCIQLIQKRHMGGQLKEQKINGVLVPGLRIIPDKNGNVHDIWELPQDPEVFKDIDDGKVETVFQLDSASARQWLQYFKGIIHGISDMAIFTALDRPGPLDYMVQDPDNPSQQINMLVEYSRRAKGKAGSEEIVKELDTLCPETKGIMIYQESLMKVYQYFTGCTLAEAEEFRGNVGKKKKDKIEKAYKLFMERAVSKVSADSAQRVWDSIITFSKYGFNCLDQDQEVLTENGPKAIKNLVEGDKVASLNPETDQIEYTPCDVWQTGEKEIFEVTLEDGTTICGTKDHKFLYKGVWVTLNDLIFIGEVQTYEDKNTETKNQL